MPYINQHFDLYRIELKALLCNLLGCNTYLSGYNRHLSSYNKHTTMHHAHVEHLCHVPIIFRARLTNVIMHLTKVYTCTCGAQLTCSYYA